MLIICFLVAVCWFVVGTANSWTKSHDLTTSEIPLVILYGILGPFGAFLCWWINVGENKFNKIKNKTLIKRRL